MIKKLWKAQISTKTRRFAFQSIPGHKSTMAEKGIDYVARQAMTRPVTSIGDIPALNGQTICLDNRTGNKSVINVQEKRKMARRKRHDKWALLSTRAFRKRNLKLQKGSLTFEKLDPVASLWHEYAARLSGTEQSVAKMDFHGATVKVVSSPDPTLIGLSGRVVKESYGALLIISEDNQLRQVNKNHTVIDIETPHGHFEVNLSAVRCRPFLKATKRWKQRTPLDLPY